MIYLFFLVCFVIAVTFSLANLFYQKSKEAAFIENLDVRFEGIVEEIDELGDRNEMVYLRLMSCSVENYDMRDSLESSVGLIKGDRAELIFSYRNLKIGDSVRLSQPGSILMRFREGREPREIWFSTVKSNSYRVNRRHRL
ncbi:MAG: hypothetical protein AAF206_05420 [Bacteroidota bacterium]